MVPGARQTLRESVSGDQCDMDTLKVTMFGRFALSWQGEDIILGRNASSKFTQLLQLIWMQGDEGISKHQLLEFLYQDEELANPGNSLNNLIFQMRKQMVAAGLPKMNYIVRRGRSYYPDPQVPLEVDLREFRKAMTDARDAESDEEKEAFYTRAMDLYRGDLLPDAYTQVWVVMETVKVSNEFAEACRYVGTKAKERGDYELMYQVYEKAAKLFPDRGWQADQIDALILQNKFREAHQLYNETIEKYSNEMGVPPTEEMLDNYRKMSHKITSPFRDIGEIQFFLHEDPASGAYYCSYPSFIDMYRVFARNMERTGFSIYMQLCTLVDYEGKAFTNKDKLSARSEELKACISKSLRKGDIFTRYSSSQYLVLLIACDREGCQVVARRIGANFREMAGAPADVRFSDVSVADLPGVTEDAAK